MTFTAQVKAWRNWGGDRTSNGKTVVGFDTHRVLCGAGITTGSGGGGDESKWRNKSVSI